MKILSRRLLYWTPRLLCIAFAIFISLFALDVFHESLPFWRMVLALVMHLVPTFAILLLLALSWRWEWVGGIGFAVLGFLYIIMFRGRFPLSTYFVIAGPVFLLGVLFWLNWKFRKELRATS